MRKILITIFICLLYLSISTSCQSSQPDGLQLTPTKILLSTDNSQNYQNKPVEIQDINPDEQISYVDYLDSLNSVASHRGVNLELRYPFERFMEMNLYLNGELVPNNFRRTSMGLMPGPWYVSWGTELDPGIYQAHFTALLDTGELIEYQWIFEIAESE